MKKLRSLLSGFFTVFSSTSIVALFVACLFVAGCFGGGAIAGVLGETSWVWVPVGISVSVVCLVGFWASFYVAMSAD